jgi:hypothetical protein
MTVLNPRGHFIVGVVEAAEPEEVAAFLSAPEAAEPEVTVEVTLEVTLAQSARVDASGFCRPRRDVKDEELDLAASSAAFLSANF